MILGQQLVGVNHNGLTMLLFILIKVVTFESIGPNIRLLIEFFLTVSGAGEGFSTAAFGISSSSSSESADRWRLEETFTWDLFIGLWWGGGADDAGGRGGGAREVSWFHFNKCVLPAMVLLRNTDFLWLLTRPPISHSSLFQKLGLKEDCHQEGKIPPFFQF